MNKFATFMDRAKYMLGLKKEEAVLSSAIETVLGSSAPVPFGSKYIGDVELPQYEGKSSIAPKQKRSNHFTPQERERTQRAMRESEEGRIQRMLDKGHKKYNFEGKTVVALNLRAAHKKEGVDFDPRMDYNYLIPKS